VEDRDKDDSYWEKRLKNNVAARRSREARRLKENQIALRAAFLESENAELRRKLANVLMQEGEIDEEKRQLRLKLAGLE